MLTRRTLLVTAGALAFAAALHIPTAGAQDAAGAFVRGFADQLVAIVNGPQAYEAKKAALGPAIDQNVDVARIARFCLGRYWQTASPAQQAEYTDLFHKVLLNNIAGHLGEYRGVSVTLGGSRPSADGEGSLVETTIARPNTPPADVQWVVATSGGAPKVVDVVAEGTSLRLTQRSDYSSYLVRHGGNVDQLIAALKRQLASS